MKIKCEICNEFVFLCDKTTHESSEAHIFNNIKKVCERCLQELYIVNFVDAEKHDLCRKCLKKVYKKCKSCSDLFEQSTFTTTAHLCPQCVFESDNLRYDNVVFVDLETSDLAIHLPQILEIGAYSNEGVFSRFCHPYMQINPEASKVNGFTVQDNRLFKNNALVTNIDTEVKVLKEFVNWLPSHRFTFVAYNIAFDKKVLQAQLRKYKIKCKTPHRWVCAMELIKAKTGRTVSLKNAMTMYNIPFESNNLHGALYDSKCLKQLFEAVCKLKTAAKGQKWKKKKYV